MRAASTLSAIGAAICVLASTSAHALGFGRVTNSTQLGQPLNFSAALHLDNDEFVARECVSADVQSGDNHLAPGQVRASLEGNPDSPDRSIRVTTTTVIDEPVVTVSVTIGCQSKVTRKFVAFIDPPVINLAQSGGPANAPAPSDAAAPAVPAPVAPRNDSTVGPLTSMIEGDRPPAARPRPQTAEPTERPPAPRPRPRPRPVARANNAQPAVVPPSKPAVQRREAIPPRPVASASGPRLRLEAPPAVAPTPTVAASAPAPQPTLAQAAPAPAPAAVASAAAAAASGAASVAAGASISAAEADQLAQERDRIKTLEDGLNKLRVDSQATQSLVATLQGRLKQAESERYANPLVYALAWLCALLAAGIAALLWRQSRGRAASQWWAAPGPTPVAPGSVQPVPPVAAPAAAAAAIQAEPVLSAPTQIPTTRPAAFDVPTIADDYPSTLAPQTQPGPFMPTAPMTVMSGMDEATHESSVEELIDLEQQAEFFIVLGQDDAAIELLMSHVRNDGGISPLPYLKLLEIYRRRGEHDAYERIRERFNRRFNAYAPDWNADLQHGRSLEDYPGTMTSLKALWGTPTRVMETLDASLFRRNKSDETFDLPAYRELLFLFSIARDLAEHAGMLPAGDVDFLLPLSDDPNAAPIERLSASAAAPVSAPAPIPRSSPTPGFENSDMMTMPLDLDITMDPPEPGRPIIDHMDKLDKPQNKPLSFDSDETLPAALRRGPDELPPDSGFIDFDLDSPFKPKDPKKGS